jgi:hypothetical protein
MQNIAFSVLVFLISFNIFCMHINNNIGHIDMLILARLVLENGYEQVRQDINRRQIVKNPYCISHRCFNNDFSALSDQVFEKIFLGTNNQDLDICTKYKRIKNSEDVIVTANFYDKKTLLAALEFINKVLQTIDKDRA